MLKVIILLIFKITFDLKTKNKTCNQIQIQRAALEFDHFYIWKKKSTKDIDNVHPDRLYNS